MQHIWHSSIHWKCMILNYIQMLNSKNMNIKEIYSIPQVKWMALEKPQQDQLKLILLEADPNWEQVST